VCLRAKSAFEAIDSLKELLKDFKATDNTSPENEILSLNQEQIDKIKSLLVTFKVNFEFINKKKSIRLIRKKIVKKRRSQKIDKEENYTKILINFAKSHKIFENKKLDNPNVN
jgi:hypothetical protein